MFHLKTAFSEATGYRTKNGRCEPLDTAASLDRPVQPDEPDGGTLGELVPDSRAADAIENVEESVYHEQLHKAIEGAISELSPDNAQVLRLRYWGDMTLSAVGEVMGKSPERTRQMENKGIRELRKSKTLHRFLDFDMYRGTGLGAFRLSGSSIQEQYILKQERREEYERKRRKEQAFEEEADAMTPESCRPCCFNVPGGKAGNAGKGRNHHNHIEQRPRPDNRGRGVLICNLQSIAGWRTSQYSCFWKCLCAASLFCIS